MDQYGESFKIRDKKRYFEGLSDMNRAGDKLPPFGKCMYWREACSRPIGSHSISRSWLEQISENGHVQYLRLNAQNLSREPLKIVDASVGIREASVFQGFCSDHDSELFSVFERQPFTGTPEQLHLLAYRSVCREACIKYQITGSRLKQGMVEKEPTPHGVRTVQEVFWTVELLAMKQELEDALGTSTLDVLSHYVIRFGKTPQMLVSTNFIPLVTATGRKLESRPDDRLTLNVIPTGTGGFAVFSWRKRKPKNGSLFVKSLRDLNSARLTHVLVKLAMEVSDNAFFDPKWWRSLGHHQDRLKTAFARNLTMGDDSPPADLFSRPEAPVADWQVEERWFV